MLGTVCAAQSVTTTLSSSTMVAGAILLGGTPSFMSQPAGPIATTGAFLHAGAVIPWQVVEAPYGYQILFSHSLTNGIPPAGSTVSAEGTFTVEFAATAATMVSLALVSNNDGTAGATFPSATFDLHADASIEQDTSEGPITGLWVLPIAPGQALRVAIDMNTVLPPNAVFLRQEVELWLQPANNLHVLPAALACGAPGTFQTVRTRRPPAAARSSR